MGDGRNIFERDGRAISAYIYELEYLLDRHFQASNLIDFEFDELEPQYAPYTIQSFQQIAL
jgi:hypothetical protein